jgi:hypothetical protein
VNGDDVGFRNADDAFGKDVLGNHHVIWIGGGVDPDRLRFLVARLKSQKDRSIAPDFPVSRRFAGSCDISPGIRDHFEERDGETAVVGPGLAHLQERTGFHPRTGHGIGMDRHRDEEESREGDGEKSGGDHAQTCRGRSGV